MTSRSKVRGECFQKNAGGGAICAVVCEPLDRSCYRSGGARERKRECDGIRRRSTWNERQHHHDQRGSESHSSPCLIPSSATRGPLDQPRRRRTTSTPSADFKRV